MSLVLIFPRDAMCSQHALNSVGPHHEPHNTFYWYSCFPPRVNATQSWVYGTCPDHSRRKVPNLHIVEIGVFADKLLIGLEILIYIMSRMT